MLRLSYTLSNIPIYLIICLCFCFESCDDSHYINQCLHSLNLDETSQSRQILQDIKPTVRDSFLSAKIRILDFYLEKSDSLNIRSYITLKEKQLEYIDDMIPKLIEEKDSLTTSVAFFIKGLFHLGEKQYIASFSSLSNASDFVRDLNQNKLKYRIYNLLSDIYEEYAVFEKEITNREMALMYANETGDEQLIINSTHKLARVYISTDSTSSLAIPILNNILTKNLPQSLCPYIYADLADFHNQSDRTDSAIFYINKSINEKADTVISHEFYRIKGDIFLKSGDYDKAIDNYSLSLQCTDPENKLTAYYGLYETYKQKHDYTEACNYMDKFCAYLDSFSKHSRKWEIERTNDVEAYKLLRRLNINNQIDSYRTTLKNQKHMLVSICIVGVLIIALSLIVIKKSQLEREIMKKKASYLENQNHIMNRLLKEREEKEKLLLNEQVMKTEYYKRLNMISVPILSAPKNKKGFIFLSKTDWDIIIENTNACFNTFTKRLEKRFPDITEDEIRFCCLLKMEMSLSLLSLIYHVEKSSISKKKTRLKDKLKINNKSLDEFIRFF